MRKAMIHCELSLKTSRKLIVDQLRPELLGIIKNYREYFEGKEDPRFGFNEDCTQRDVSE